MASKKKIKMINLLKAFSIIELLIIFALAASTVVLALKYNQTVPANADTEHEVRIRPYIEKEETFYQYNGKKILMHNDHLGEVFIPAFGDVPENTVTPDDLARDPNGYLTYIGSGGLSSKVGIDISEHQGDIDWEQVRGAGIDFVMIRAGYRTYGNGIISMDNAFLENIDGAAAAGLDVGVYFYSQAVNPEEAIEEADAILQSVAGHTITYPIVFDWEVISGDMARTDAMSVENLADCCVSFCERVKSAGYTPMIYMNTSTAMNKLDLPRVKDYEFWLAEYTDFPTFFYKFDMWQYSSAGEVPGIEGAVDLNISFKDYSTIKPE